VSRQVRRVEVHDGEAVSSTLAVVDDVQLRPLSSPR
jgi:hypothetical protein